MRGMCRGSWHRSFFKTGDSSKQFSRAPLKRKREGTSAGVGWGGGQEGDIRPEHPGEHEHVKVNPALCKIKSLAGNNCTGFLGLLLMLGRE